MQITIEHIQRDGNDEEGIHRTAKMIVQMMSTIMTIKRRIVCKKLIVVMSPMTNSNVFLRNLLLCKQYIHYENIELLLVYTLDLLSPHKRSNKVILTHTIII